MIIDVKFQNQQVRKEVATKVLEIIRLKMMPMASSSHRFHVSFSDVNRRRGKIGKECSVIFTGPARSATKIKTIAKNEIEGIRAILKKLKNKISIKKTSILKELAFVRPQLH